MKRLLCLLLCLLMVPAFCACGEKTGREKPTDMESSLPAVSSSQEAPEATEEPADQKTLEAEEAVRKALKLKDRQVSELYDAIGEPVSEDAAPSCMGPGEDVNRYYEGFTVYTYREGNSQNVVDAELNP